MIGIIGQGFVGNAVYQKFNATNSNSTIDTLLMIWMTRNATLHSENYPKNVKLYSFAYQLQWMIVVGVMYPL